MAVTVGYGRRSFARGIEVEDSEARRRRGSDFDGEGILAITKALLQAGVGYVGGYQGAPISHLMDVLADAKDCWTSSACISKARRAKRPRPPCWPPR
jgi:hypothetical protein